MNDASGGLLAGIRVIDIATERGELAGRLLADLGAEVIKIEPPGGSPSRRLPPFIKGKEQDPDGSLFWAAVALGKRSVVLDIQSEEGRRQLRALTDGADVFIESFDPGMLAALGIGGENLRRSNPALIAVSITPFGQDGPAAHTPAADITLQAAGGLVSLQGDGDRQPIPVGEPYQAAFHAASQAAADVIIALNERDRSGQGQSIDTSMQTAMIWTLMNASGYPPNQGINPPGTCEERSATPISQLKLFGIDVDMPTLWECADGVVTAGFGIGGVGAASMQAAMRWLAEERFLGPEDQDLAEVSWLNWTLDYLEGRMAKDKPVRAVARLIAFFKAKTKVELLDRAVRDSILIAPIYTTADIVADPQMQARDYWVSLGGRPHPGAMARMSRISVAPTRPAPSVGADQALAQSPHKPSAPAVRSGKRTYAFEGLKVADFAWVGVGPIIAKGLSDHGATVVHVESETRPDVLRIAPPFKNGQQDLNKSQFFANFNSSKYGLACNLATPAGRALARRLVLEWADVVVESFTPGNMAKMGLDYASLSKERPDLVMLSTCLRGQTGPHSTYAGFGGQGAALAGLHGVTGWPDRNPSGPWGAYTDFITPRYGVSVLAAAIFERNRSGKGQYIDLSQVEASIHFLEPEVLDYAVNGRIAPPAGDASPLACPNGIYQTQGQQRYIALSVRTPEQWQALRRVAPLDAFSDPAFDRLEARRGQEFRLQGALRAWLAEQDPWAITQRLQTAGVPAYVVLRPSDLYEDPQVLHRGFFITLDHAVMGPTPYDGLVSRFSGMPVGPRFAGPTLGQHTNMILRDFLGLSEEQISEYAAAGVLA